MFEYRLVASGALCTFFLCAMLASFAATVGSSTYTDSSSSPAQDDPGAALDPFALLYHEFRRTGWTRYAARDHAASMLGLARSFSDAELEEMISPDADLRSVPLLDPASDPGVVLYRILRRQGFDHDAADRRVGEMFRTLGVEFGRCKASSATMLFCDDNGTPWHRDLLLSPYCYTGVQSDDDIKGLKDCIEATPCAPEKHHVFATCIADEDCFYHNPPEPEIVNGMCVWVHVEGPKWQNCANAPLGCGCFEDFEPDIDCDSLEIKCCDLTQHGEINCTENCPECDC